VIRSLWIARSTQNNWQSTFLIIYANAPRQHRCFLSQTLQLMKQLRVERRRRFFSWMTTATVKIAMTTNMFFRKNHFVPSSTTMTLVSTKAMCISASFNLCPQRKITLPTPILLRLHLLSWLKSSTPETRKITNTPWPSHRTKSTLEQRCKSNQRNITLQTHFVISLGGYQVSQESIKYSYTKS